MTTLVFTLLLVTLLHSVVNTQEYEDLNEKLPEFMGPLPNLTVAVGRDAQIPCSINNLGTYKAAWLRVEDKGILTIHEHVISRNYRISLTHNQNRNFVLNIRNVQEVDKGGYMCQINTVPMKSQVGYLEVVFPPEIIVEETSNDYVVTEGSNLTLHCKARGHPSPTIVWKREDKKAIPLHNYQGKKYAVRNITGESLTITRVTRMHMGAYLCIASNGIPPSVSRRVFLGVQFPPAVWIPNQMIGTSLYQDVTLTCHIEAFPSSINYWIKDSGTIIAESDEKYILTSEEKEYKIHSSLTIREIQSDDFGSYTCLAKNVIGVQEGTIKVYEIPEHQRRKQEARKKALYNRNGQVTKQTDYLQANNERDGVYSASESQVSAGFKPSISWIPMLPSFVNLYNIIVLLKLFAIHVNVFLLNKINNIDTYILH